MQSYKNLRQIKLSKSNYITYKVKKKKFTFDCDNLMS